MDELGGLLRDAVVQGEPENLEALARSGPVAVEGFRDWLAGDRTIPLPAGNDQGHIDSTMELSAFLGTRFPGQYLAAFNNARWISSTFVLCGLGYTRRAEARAILIEALASQPSEFTRLSAAMALRKIPGHDSVRALLRALDDPDYLVQYQAVESLGVIGDRAVLDRLMPLATDPPNRGIGSAAASAVKSLAERLGIDIDPNRIKYWRDTLLS